MDEFNAVHWDKLRTALSILSHLPPPAEVATIVRRNVQRTEYVSRHVLAAKEWLDQFETEVNR